MSTKTLVFLDTETTSLRHDRRAWEIAIIVRAPGQNDMEKSWFVQADDLDMAGADLNSLKIGRFFERHPHMNGDLDKVGLISGLRAAVQTYPEAAVLSRVEALTRDALIVGAVPNFDTEVLGARMRAHGICPSWHYHLVDVETLAAGALTYPPPWDFDKVLKAYHLVYDEADRHTALGDARMVRDLYDAVFAKPY